MAAKIYKQSALLATSLNTKVNEMKISLVAMPKDIKEWVKTFLGDKLREHNTLIDERVKERLEEQDATLDDRVERRVQEAIKSLTGVKSKSAGKARITTHQKKSNNTATVARDKVTAVAKRTTRREVDKAIGLATASGRSTRSRQDLRDIDVAYHADRQWRQMLMHTKHGRR